MNWIGPLRSGAWLTHSRLRILPLILLATFGVVVATKLIVHGSGLSGQGSLLFGTDFIAFYTASDLLLAGLPETAYDPRRFYEAQHLLIQFEATAFAAWFYPPTAFLPIAPLATLPFVWAFAIWSIVGIALYLAVVWAILPRPETIPVALTFVGALVNVGYGQNGFLTTVLFGGAFLMLERTRFWAAGLLVALLLYKPHFGILIPIALIAGGYWRAVATATFLAIGFIVLNWAILGSSTWVAFFSTSWTYTRELALEQGSSGWHKLLSVYSMVRFAGGAPSLAYVFQAASILTLAVLTALIWRRKDVPFAVKAAFLIAAALAAAPYLFEYDLTLLALVIAWMVVDGLHRGFLPWEKSGLVLVWIWPLFCRELAHILHFQFTPIMFGALLSMIYRRAGSIESGPMTSRIGQV